VAVATLLRVVALLPEMSEVSEVSDVAVSVAVSASFLWEFFWVRYRTMLVNKFCSRLDNFKI
jgi:hypothetical protein